MSNPKHPLFMFNMQKYKYYFLNIKKFLQLKFIHPFIFFIGIILNKNFRLIEEPHSSHKQLTQLGLSKE
tara:strand:+ start:612 stop:818 length:207 start_codon:yes stop_codon:yes gene_type:complete